MTEKLNLTNSLNEYERGKENIPGGVLGIRRPYNFVEGEYPIYFDKAKGGRIEDIDGNEYIDYLCAYGPILLGYREEEIDEAVIKQIREKGFCFSLTQKFQNDLAVKMREHIPCAEMSLFVTTGSDATTSAIRIARSYTQKTKVLRCGYHGWHNWCVEVKGGVPKKVYEDIHEFHYNDLENLESLLKEHENNTAAVIITPFAHPTAKPMEAPKPGYLESVKELAHRYGAVVIFDEIRTGFRVTLGGAQKYYGVTPDMAVFGKAMANGYPIGAVAGKKEFMKEAVKNVFISSTFFPNSISHVAALKTIELLENNDILETIWKKGEYLMNGIKKILVESKIDADLTGIPPMFFITFPKNEDGSYKAIRKEFYTEMIRKNVFLQPYHHWYVCYRHTDKDLKYTLKSIDETFKALEEKYC
ncbi:MAG: aminotransferase class III-fold pyridoxal phosphate-dependent enzyme [Victivallales bacterium]|nr:aminotransferase class III-fold pyridoxal phosphate-dependent enzyme [Victivallales bacterium]